MSDKISQMELASPSALQENDVIPILRGGVNRKATMPAFPTPDVFSEGANGLVPGPTEPEIAANKVLRADGAWVDQASTADLVAYTPETPGNWPVPPTDVAAALDEVITLVGGGPSPSSAHIVNVNKGGNDAGTGSAASPFLTIGAALASITDNADGKRYVILVGPGAYIESVVLKQFVDILGASPQETFIGDASHPFLLPNVDNATFYVSKVGFIGTVVGYGPSAAPYSTYAFFNDCQFTGSNARAQNNLGAFNYSGCVMNGHFFLKGSHVMVGCYGGNWGGTTPDSQEGSVFLKYVGCSGDLITYRGSSSVPVSATFSGCSFGSLSITDDPTAVTLNYGPSNFGTLTFTGGSPVITYGPVQYFPATPGDWAGMAPVTVAEALDRLAAANPGA